MKTNVRAILVAAALLGGVACSSDDGGGEDAGQSGGTGGTGGTAGGAGGGSGGGGAGGTGGAVGGAGGSGGVVGGAGGAGGECGDGLPPCPLPCVGIQPGGDCDDPAAICGNAIGDTCRCDGRTWQCEVHPPLGEGCNLVCKPEDPNPNPTCATACECESGLGCFNGTCRVGITPIFCCDAEACPEDAWCELRAGGYQQCRPSGECVTTADCFDHPAPIRCQGAWDCDPTQSRPSDTPGADGCNYTCVFNLVPCEPGQICPFGDECLPCPVGGENCGSPNVCLDPDYGAR